MKDDNGIREPMVLLDGVELKLDSEAGSVNILKGINLEIAAGETVSVVGPSGSGKTSMMMLIGGLERQTAGSIHVAGHDLATLDEDGLARFRRDNVGIVFQNFHLVPTMNAMENVAIPVELAGSTTRSTGRGPLLLRSGSTTGCRITRASYRAANSSAWRLPAPSSPSRA